MPPAENQRAPLWAVLALTFAGSMGTGAVANGVFFVATSQFDFGHASNFGLGLVLGIVYIPSALYVGPALRRLIRASSLVTSKRTMIALNALLALACLALPPLASTPLGLPAIWVFMAVFSALTGSYWPIVESYLSGGRKDRDLRIAVGRFNITWTLAVAVSLVAMSPIIKEHPMATITMVGLSHVLSGLFVFALPPDPPAHPPDTPHDVPESYRRLLRINRVLLPASYVVMSALNPYWPVALKSLTIVGGLQTLLVSTWMFARVGTVITLERWHGWHGSRAMPAFGTLTLAGGFALAIAAPALGQPTGLPVVFIALALVGIGAATIYTGALYYVLEVSTESVDAGGTHEALIGVGYATGPILGLAAVGTESAGMVPEGGFRWVLLGSAGAVFAGAAAFAASLGARRTESGSTHEPIPPGAETHRKHRPEG